MLASIGEDRRERNRIAKIEAEHRAAIAKKEQDEAERRRQIQAAREQFQRNSERLGRGVERNPQPFDFKTHGQIGAAPYQREVPVGNVAMSAADLAVRALEAGYPSETIDDLIPLWQRGGLGARDARRAIEVENKLAPEANTVLTQGRLRDEFETRWPTERGKIEAESEAARQLGRSRAEDVTTSVQTRTPGTPIFAPPTPPTDPAAASRDKGIRSRWKVLEDEEAKIAATYRDVEAKLAAAQAAEPSPGLLARMKPGAPPSSPLVRGLQARRDLVAQQLQAARRKREMFERDVVRRYLPEAGQLVGGGGPNRPAAGEQPGETITRAELRALGRTEDQAAAAGLTVVD